MNRHEIAAVINEVGTLLELQGENPFKIQAYFKGARRLESLSDAEFNALAEAGTLASLPGIGKALAEKITELYQTGEMELYKTLKEQTPDGLIEMLSIPGLGAKKIKVIHQKLGIDTLEALSKACEEGQIAALSGFGKKSEENILTGLQHLQEYGQRYLWWHAMEVAQKLLDELRQLPSVKQADVAGSLRRRKETIGDIDLLVASAEPDAIMDHFVALEQVASITGRGSTKCSVRLEGGRQVDLRIVPETQYAFALQYFTGSKEHNVALRHRAREQGLTLNEYGLEPLDEKHKAPLAGKKVPKESDIYSALGLHWMPPELREDGGELEAAAENTLPKLIEYGDIRGAFHNHTIASDGRNTLEEMAASAKALGWDYLGIADHSKSSVQANGLNEERLLEQLDRIRQLNQSKQLGVHLFAGTECDVLPDGSLDFADDILAQLDYVVVSIHSSFGQDEESMTQRLIKAIENPYSTMVGHLTGRLLLRREAYALNVEKVIDAAIANHTIVELNAHPRRLDMDWRHWHRAADQGLICSINPDAHTTEGLRYVEAGVNSARKGWLEPKHVLNTWSLKNVQEFFESR